MIGTRNRSTCLLSSLILASLISAATADERIILKSGLSLQGLIAEQVSLNLNAFQQGGQGPVKARPILMVDDGLRRTYVHRRGMVAGDRQDVRGAEITITLKQDVPLAGNEVQGIGDILGVSPFTEFGRRTITVRGPQGGALDILQGITEINSRYAVLKALKGRPSYDWKMSVATRAIRPEVLQKIFRRRLDQTDLDQRLVVVRFFIEANRFRAAEEELARIIRDFPEEAAMKRQLTSIVQQQATQLIDEAKRRAKVGQVQYARSVFDRFPMNAVGRTTRIQISDELKRLDEIDVQVNSLTESLETDIKTLPQETQEGLAAIHKEIYEGLSEATLTRLSDYSRLRNAQNTPVENRVALAIAGWLLGPGSGEQNLVVTQALVKVRDLVAEYLGDTTTPRRQEILETLRSLEGAQIEYVSKLLPNLAPTMQWPEGSEDEVIQGFYRIGKLNPKREPTADVTEPDYLIQLPPEYNPLRQYPCIVALSAPTSSPEAELVWWADNYSELIKGRIGHAMRNGYIVISPKWSRDGQRTYEYTPREHHAVLSTLRHAMRRASIDSDRVFLAGHDEGATAAWDIALSHPDYWAGLVSYNGEPSKTVQHYFPNGRNLPMYFVMGESSGPKPPLVRMGAVLDDYMHVRNDAMVVMYKGRGREDFYEEITDTFRWMNVATRVRKPIPEEFEAVTMRSGDQYFWWLELGPLKPLVDLNPVLWDQEKRKKAGPISGNVGAGNQIRFSGPSENFTIWLRPDMGLDLTQPVIARRGSRTTRFSFDGSLNTILEDTRQRADRKRPFWAKFEVP